MIEWEVVIRRWIIAAVFIVVSLGYGKIKDVDTDTLRPWVQYVRERQALRLLVLGIVAATGATLFDWYVFQFLIGQYETSRLLGHFTVILGILSLGAGFPLGEWVTHINYQAVEGWDE